MLQTLFPGVLMLDIDQVASLMKYGRGHLYNLSSQGNLPFKISRGVGNKLLVSIVEMAAYLDRTMLTEYEPAGAAEPLLPLVVKKRGRPRGSTSKPHGLALAFQTDLHATVARMSGAQPTLELPVQRRLLPFFIDSNGLLLATAVDERPLPAEGNLLHIRWMQWDEALAEVWSDEALRLHWLQTMAHAVPTLYETVEERRATNLRRI